MQVAALKTALFACANAAGVSGCFANTAWRCRRLLILCYHGVSLGDEHQWNPTLYISPRTLSRRLDALRRLGCSVLSLSEAIDRLYETSLPKRAVVLTFDDGYYTISKRRRCHCSKSAAIRQPSISQPGDGRATSASAISAHRICRGGADAASCRPVPRVSCR